MSENLVKSLEQKNRELKELLGQANKRVAELQAKDDRRTMRDIVTEHAKGRVRPEAIEDAILRAEAVFTVSAGAVVGREGSRLTVDKWLDEMLPKNPHWEIEKPKEKAAPTVNPWSKRDWNITAQGQYIQQHGIQKAELAARAAGVPLIGMQPAV